VLAVPAGAAERAAAGAPRPARSWLGRLPRLQRLGLAAGAAVAALATVFVYSTVTGGGGLAGA
jgi:hypothetical protein